MRLVRISLQLFLIALLTVPAFGGEDLPCFHKDDFILFQGDSITDGGRQRTGNDYNHIMGQDYAYILSSELGERYPERNLTFINRGISGNNVVDLAERWATDTLAVKPNFLSILIGINDTVGSKKISAETYEQTYDKLLADTRLAMPDLKILLCEPFLLPVGKFKDTYADNMVELKKRQETVARLAGKYHLPLVQLQKAFTDACQKAPPDHWSWDGVHPTYAGHGLIARCWLQTVRQAWPADSPAGRATGGDPSTRPADR
jgi:lysophospholipase L1-like esterase